MITPSLTLDGVAYTTKVIYPNNAFLVRQYFETFSATLNATAPWTGAPNVQATICTDRAGLAPVTGLGPFALTELSGFPGWYVVTLSGAQTAALLTAALGGTFVYLLVTGGNSTELRVVTPLYVAPPRTIF